MTKGAPEILIVEDDDSTRLLLETYVELAGYVSVSAKDGRVALDMAKRYKPRLVVLDLMLPEIHGVGVCQALKQNPDTRAAKVLIVSAKIFPADRRQAEESRADLFMSKPLDRDAFIGVLQGLLGKNT